MAVKTITRKINSYGFNQRGRKPYARPAAKEFEVFDETKPFTPDIIIRSTAGVKAGIIRTDNQKSILKKLSITLDEKGCADFELVLSDLPAFEILPFSTIHVNLFNSSNDIFGGVVTLPDDIQTVKAEYVFKGFGYRRYLQNLKANTTYTSGTDLSDVIDDIVQTWITPYCPIEYNASLIENPSGVALVNDIELGKYTIDTILDILIQATQTDTYYYIWGVNGDGDFYFKKISKVNIINTHYVGYQYQNFEGGYDYNNVKNVITLTRKQSAATGGAGWSIAGVYSDTASINTYGRNEVSLQLPGYFTNSDADLIGNAMIDDLKEPKFKAKISGKKLELPPDLLDFGLHRVILQGKQYLTLKKLASAIDSAGDFTILPLVLPDMTKTTDAGYLIYGSGSVRFEWGSGAGGNSAYMSINLDGEIKEIRFYLRANYQGTLIRAGIGTSPFIEYTKYIDVPIVNEFFPVVLDFEAEGLSSADYFGFFVNEVKANDTVKIWIDKLEVVYKGFDTKQMLLKRVKYDFAPDGSDVTAELGTINKGLPQYVAALQKISEDLIYTGEEI